jgi:hypothetical protein
MASDVPVKYLRPLVDWRDELGLHRLRADLIGGDLDAWWYDHYTGEYHQIPRAHWQQERAVERAIESGWPIGMGRLCEIHAVRPADWPAPQVSDSPGRRPDQVSAKDRAWGLAKDILENDDARARLPKGRGRLSRLAEFVQDKLRDYKTDSIRRMIGPSLREWESKNPDK